MNYGTVVLIKYQTKIQFGTQICVMIAMLLGYRFYNSLYGFSRSEVR